MRLVFDAAATAAEREAAGAAVRARGIEFASGADALELAGAPDAEDALALAALPGVASVEPSTAPPANVREAILAWTGGAATVLAILSIAAANLPATIGAPADPLRTPSPLRPSWPLLAWYAAVDRAPSWVPVPLIFVVAALVLFFWPDVAKPLAKRPVLHALVGVTALAAVAGLVALEIAR